MIFKYHLLLSLAFFVAEDADVIVPRPEPAKWAAVKADADGRVWLKVPGEQPASEWELIDRTGAWLDVPPGSAVAVFAASKPGAYRVVAVSDGKLIRYAIQVGDVVPPAPPVPPTPPIPPPPIDALTRQLQAAFDSDKGSTKVADLRQLIALYTEAAEITKSPEFATAADLFNKVISAGALLLPDVEGVRRLGAVRKVIAGELSTVLPTDPDDPLTESVRASAAAAFLKYAKALQGITP
jgi:hypothetical protein